MNERKIRVALADDQRLLREGLRIILEAAPDMIVVGEAEDGITATTLAAIEQPDVMLMDIRMPRCDGIVATEIIRTTHPSVRIILLTTYGTPELVIEGLHAGAPGYVLKDCSAEDLYASIHAVARGQVLLQATSAAQLLAGLSLPLPPSSPQLQKDIRCARVQLAQQLSRVTSLVNEMATSLSASAIVG